MRKLSIFFYLVFCFCHSQETRISGKVIDESSQETISFATITLKNQDSIVDGTISDEKGRFQLKTIRDFNVIEVSFMGYEIKTLPKERMSNLEDLNITLVSSIINMEEVTVLAERTTTQQKIDRRVVNLGADLQQAGTTALEAFDQLAEIQTDLSTGVISLRGSSDVRLLINGKPSGWSAGTLLNQIPSSSIDRVEIITAPSAKEQADGISGIINVILKKNKLTGLNLNLNSGYGTYRYNYGLDGNWNKNKLNFRFNLGDDRQDYTSFQTLDRLYSDGFAEAISTQYNNESSVQRISLGLDIFANSNNEFSLDWAYTDDYFNANNPSLFTTLSGEDDYSYTRSPEASHYTHTINANFRHKFKDENHFIELDYNLNANNNDFIATDFRDNTFLLREDYDYDNTLHFLGIDYSFPLHERSIVEFGGAWNDRKLTSDYFFQGQAIENLDAFDYQESILAVYAQLRWQTKKIQVQAGIRHENFESSSRGTQVSFSSTRQLDNLFPSFHMSYDINEQNQLNFGIRRRVARPNFRHINPFQLGYPFFEFRGNPNLLPEFSNNLELNYQYSDNDINLSLSTFYRHRTDVIQRIDFFTEEEVQVQVASFDNGGDNTSIGIEGNIGFKPLSFWNVNLAANYFATSIEEEQLVTFNELYSSTIQLRNTFNVNPKWTTDISYRHDAKQQQAFRFVEPRNRIDWALRGRFFDDKLSLSLRVVDVLNNNLMFRNTFTENTVQEERWDFATQSRNYLISASYKLFSNTKLLRKRKQRDYSHGGTTG